jgi:diguanylate cyclase (GGDEF)-like protein
MKKKKRSKHMIPYLLGELSKIKNINLVEKNENILVSKYLSSLLFLIAGINFFVIYGYLSKNISFSIIHSSIYLVLGACFHISAKLKFNQSIINKIISVLTFTSLTFLMISFYTFTNSSMWLIPTVPLVLAVIRISPNMLIAILSSILISIIHNTISLGLENLIDIVAIWFIFIVLVAVSLLANKISSVRYSMVLNQLNLAIKRKERLSYLANHDTLTGLPNRKYFDEFIENEIKSNVKNRTNFAILFLDIDNFKLINDSLGHIAGDKILVKVTERLHRCIKEFDLLARFGGDEFMIALTDIDDIESINNTAKQLIDCFEKPFSLQKKDYYISTSIGIAIYPVDGVDSITLMKNADTALYEAKARGKNTYVVSTEIMKERINEKVMLTNSLYEAIENEEFELYYQPQVKSNSSEIIGVEALIRWHHPKLGFILPNTFIPLAEKSGLIIPIGKWVLENACKEINKLNEKYNKDLKIAVNISARQLYNEDIIDFVKSTLHANDLDPNNLELEITESMALVAQKDIIHVINGLNDLGVSIVIDDFGVKYSSLDYLKKITARKLKIDMSFIHGIDNKADQAIIKSIIVLAKNMGISVLAEGVEKESQLSFLKNLMCDEIQGYYFFNPLPLNNLEKTIYRKK